MNEALNEFLKTADPLCAEHDSIVDQLDTVTADRDIKAANLQLLVEKVLAWEVQDSAFQVAPELAPHFNELFALARSLKQ